MLIDVIKLEVLYKLAALPRFAFSADFQKHDEHPLWTHPWTQIPCFSQKKPYASSILRSKYFLRCQ